MRRSRPTSTIPGGGGGVDDQPSREEQKGEEEASSSSSSSGSSQHSSSSDEQAGVGPDQVLQGGGGPGPAEALHFEREESSSSSSSSRRRRRRRRNQSSDDNNDDSASGGSSSDSSARDDNAPILIGDVDESFVDAAAAGAATGAAAGPRAGAGGGSFNDAASGDIRRGSDDDEDVNTSNDDIEARLLFSGTFDHEDEPDSSYFDEHNVSLQEQRQLHHGEQEDEKEDRVGTHGTGRLARSGDTPGRHGDVDDDDDLANVQAVLGLDAERLRRCEGMFTLDDLLAIDDLLLRADTDDATKTSSSKCGATTTTNINLNSVERVRLRHYFEWRRERRQRLPRHYGGDDDERPPQFTREAYETFRQRGSRRTRRTSPHATWPFGRVISTNVLLYPLTFVAHHHEEEDGITLEDDCESPTHSNRFAEQLGLADLDLDLYESEAGTYGDLDRALGRLRRIVGRDRGSDDDDDPNHGNDHDDDDPLVHACACLKLSFLLQTVPALDLPASLELLHRAATIYHVPTALLFYGHALMTGELQGVASRDVALGVRYLYQAAAAGIGEANYVLGQHYETIGEIATATQYYDKVTHLFGPTSASLPDGSQHHRFAWRGLIAGRSAYTNAFRTRERFAIAGGPLIRSGCCGPAVVDGGTSSSLLSPVLLLLVQAVLLVASAIVGTYTQLVGHYPILLFGIPLLGLAASIHAFLHVNVDRRQEPQRQALRDSKMEAFRTVVNVPPSFPRRIVLPSLSLLYLQMVHRFQTSSRSTTHHHHRNNSDQGLRDLEAKILWIEAVVGNDRERGEHSPSRSEWLVHAALAFSQESVAVQNECSSWWDSACLAGAGTS